MCRRRASQARVIGVSSRSVRARLTLASDSEGGDDSPPAGSPSPARRLLSAQCSNEADSSLSPAFQRFPGDGKESVGGCHHRAAMQREVGGGLKTKCHPACRSTLANSPL